MKRSKEIGAKMKYSEQKDAWNKVDGAGLTWGFDLAKYTIDSVAQCATCNCSPTSGRGCREFYDQH